MTHYQLKQNYLHRLSIVVVAVLVLLPFSAFLTTWLGSNSGGYHAIQLWKELIICLSAISLIVLTPYPKLKKFLAQEKLLWGLIALYAVLTLGLGKLALSAGNVNATALIYSLIINLRFLLFFGVTYMLYSQTAKPAWVKILLIPAALVVGFGLLQLALPAAFLAHFGYSPHTILPFEYVNSNSHYFRVQSTLRGPNPLGAYLIVIMSAIVMLYFRQRKHRTILLTLGLATIFVIIFSYSRSALAGTLLSLLLLLIYQVVLAKKGQFNRRLFFMVGGFFVLVIGFGIAYRNSHVVQELLLHTDSASQVKLSSNGARVQALKVGLHDVIHEPFGRGPGTAGPASVHNNHAPRIAENYFIQIGQEVGVFGAAVFIAINGLVAYLLWRQRSLPLAVMLLASLAGITLVNMLLHAWTDDTLSLIWWGLAGMALAPSDILNKKRKHNAKKTATT